MRTDGGRRPVQKSPLRHAADLAFHLSCARRSAAALEAKLDADDSDREQARQIKDACAIFNSAARKIERRVTR